MTLSIRAILIGLCIAHATLLTIAQARSIGDNIAASPRNWLEGIGQIIDEVMPDPHAIMETLGEMFPEDLAVVNNGPILAEISVEIPTAIPAISIDSPAL